jgi:hypothetical protein
MEPVERYVKQSATVLISRIAAGLVCGLGTFCLVYHLTFYSLWRFLFGEEVWPWPQWSLVLLVAVPAVAALVACIFLLVAAPTTKHAWIAAVVASLSIFGLIRYTGEVWKVMIELGFRP